MFDMAEELPAPDVTEEFTEDDLRNGVEVDEEEDDFGEDEEDDEEEEEDEDSSSKS